MNLHYEDDRVTLWHGDCIEVLSTLPDSSVDAVVCDPPYGLEFMGKDWDKFDRKGPASFENLGDGERYRANGGSGGGRTTSPLADKPRFSTMGPFAMRAFGEWCEIWATECLRVLKPGGHMLAFGGTRTWHRLACAVEDAGFEVRDSIAWLYGCLSDDTEILTSEGWVRYDRAKEGQHALAFDTATGALAWQAIQHVHRYPYAGEMVRLHSEHTDQLLTPNHRVVLDEGRPTPHTPYVPSDQDLRRLLADVPGSRPLPVGAEADVLAGVRGAADLAAEEGQDQASRRAGGPYGAVRDLQDGDVEAGRMAQADRGGVLLEPVQRCAPGGGVGEALPQGQGGLDRRQPGVLPGEDDRAEQPRMEGRRYRVQEARELRWSALRASAGMGATDGPQGRIHHGAPATDGRPLRVPADQAGSHQPREPRPQGQPTGEPDPLALEPGAQAIRVGEDGGGRLLPSTGVTADVVDYAGVVWCITVPHGAFIARRNGLIFATGNSGFPKSLDVSKAIDKRPGVGRHAEFGAMLREAMTTKGYTNTFDVAEKVIGSRTGAVANWIKYQFPEAKWWPALRDLLDLDDETWGPVIAEAERAKVGTRAGNRLAVAPGQGMDRSAIDLDVTTHATPAAERWQGWGTALKPAFEPVVCARKPLAGTVAANVLRHGTGALNVDACRVEGEDGRPYPSMRSNTFLLDGCASVSELERLAEVDGKTPTGRSARATLSRYMAARGTGRQDNPAGRWPTNVVLDDSQAAALDEMSGESVSSDRPRNNTAEAHNRTGSMGKASSDWTSQGHSDSGGASRFFPTFRYEAKAPAAERPRVPKRMLRLRDDLTPEQVDHVRARLAEAGVRVD